MGLHSLVVFSGTQRTDQKTLDVQIVGPKQVVSNSGQGHAAMPETYPVPEGPQGPGSWELGCRTPGSN